MAPFDGNGSFELTQDFAADRDAGPPDSLISADKVMDVLKDIAAGLQDCLTRDGQNSPSANISLQGYKFTLSGNPANPGDLVNARYVANSQVAYSGLCGGTSAAITASNDFLDAVAVGTIVRATAISDNAVNPTFAAGGQTGNIVEKDGTGILAKRIASGNSFSVQWDGTDWILIETGNMVLDASIAALNALKSLVPAADKMPYYTGGETAAFTSITSFARSLLAAADTPSARAALECFPSGTTMPFVQTTAPTGWTKSTTHNDKILRIVSGSASSGGSTPFSTVFAARTIARANLPNVQLGGITSTTGNHAHEVDIPMANDFGSAGRPLAANAGGAVNGYFTSTNGNHAHTITTDSMNGGVTQTTIDFDVQHVDCIIASKN